MSNPLTDSLSTMDDEHLNQSPLKFPFLAFNDTWILTIFILSLLGFFCTIIISFLFLIHLSSRRLNGHFLLTNLFICFSVCFLYVIIILFLIRANELFCALREFLSQLAYALLFSALLCRYIMQWLGSRILSNRTKQLTSLLIYLLLIFVQIPIGILWWYFTTPRRCQPGQPLNIISSLSDLPSFTIRWPQTPFSSSCSHRCQADYRFYATFTYTILELFFCTMISTCLFFCRQCQRTRLAKDPNETMSSYGNHSLLTFFNMFALILIDLIWLSWTCIYYLTDPFFIFPATILSMISIATISLLFILIPQLYFYTKMETIETPVYKSNTTIPSSPALPPATTTTLYSNKLATSDDGTDQELLLQEKSTDSKSNRQKRKQQTLSNGSDGSFEAGPSDTYLPITRTPKGPFKVKTNEKTAANDKLHQLIYGEQNVNSSETNETKIQHDEVIASHQNPPAQPVVAPLQRQLTSSSIASDFVTPVTNNHSHFHRNPHSDLRTSSSMYSSPYPHQSRRDETIIPILCNTERPRTSTPVQMRLLINSPSSSVPMTRRIHSGTDLRNVRHPYRTAGDPNQLYHHHPAPPPPTSSPYYSPRTHQQYLFVDPYRTIPSRLGGNTWHSVLLQPGPISTRHPYIHRRFYPDQRTLSQRLWDIDSGDDDDVEEDIVKVTGRITPPKERLNEFIESTNSHHPMTDENILLHIDDETEEESYSGKQYAHV